MFRQIRHFVDAVILGRVPLLRPVVCPNGHVKRHASPIEAQRLGDKRAIRCHECFLPMRPVPHPVDTDLKTGVTVR